jgi:hypothetical protein
VKLKYFKTHLASDALALYIPDTSVQGRLKRTTLFRVIGLGQVGFNKTSAIRIDRQDHIARTQLFTDET